MKLATVVTYVVEFACGHKTSVAERPAVGARLVCPKHDREEDVASVRPVRFEPVRRWGTPKAAPK